MHIGFVSQWYDPEAGSALIPGEIARALSSRGCKVTVVTGFPNFPSGRIFPGYRQRINHREELDGITVHRVPLFPDHSEGALRRSLSYTSFALSSTLLGLPSLRNIDAFFVYGSPVTSALSLALARNWSSKPLLTYVSDLWPESVLASGIPLRGGLGGLIREAVKGAANSVYTRSDVLFATTESMKQELLERYPHGPRVSLVYNWTRETVFYPRIANETLRRTLLPTKGIVAMYAGGLGRAQNPLVWLNVARIIGDRANITFVFVGMGPLEQELNAYAHSNRLTNVKFLGHKSVQESASLIAASDVQLVSLDATPHFDHTLPSKVQAAMACGKPILAAARGETARLVSASGNFAHDPVQPHQLSRWLIEFAEMDDHQRQRLGQASREFYQQNMSLDVGITRIMAELEAL